LPVADRTWWDAKLLGEWVLANGLAYLVIVVGGVAVEQLLAGTTRAAAGVSWWLATIGVAVVGAGFHGFVLGRWQWLVLRQRLPHLRRTRWVVATFIPALAVWLLVLAPEAVDAVTAGKPTLTLFRDAFVQALVLGPLIGLAQAEALRDDTTRWRWWFVANVTSYLLAAAMYVVGGIVIAAFFSSTRLTEAFPVLAFVVHGAWMLWVTDPAAATSAVRRSRG
jgi:hypothetical protein